MLSRFFPTFLLMTALAGCNTMGVRSGDQNGSPQPDPQLTSSSEARFFSKSGLQACAGGALIGLATCKLTNTCDSDQGMVTAALVGCGVGMGAS